MTGFAAGPAWPADGITAETSDQGKACERKHKALLGELAGRLGTILAGGDSYELAWFIQALHAVSKLAVDKADELAEESRKKH